MSEAGPIVVGLASIAFAARQLGHQRKLADLAAVRDVLEAGAIQLHRAAYSMDPIKVNLIDRATSAQSSLVPLGLEYEEISERIKVRLGRRHGVTVAYVAAGDAFLEVWRAVDRVVALVLPQLDGAGRSQAMNHLEQERLAITLAREQFDARRVEFIDAAARAAGSRLRLR